MDKVVRDGKVAVLFAPSFGAGWFTWNDSCKTFLLFDPAIVEAVENKNYALAAKIATRKGKELYGENDYTCVLGADDLDIEWVKEGEKFEITEYDGSEELNVISKQTYLIA